MCDISVSLLVAVISVHRRRNALSDAYRVRSKIKLDLKRVPMTLNSLDHRI